MVDCGACLILPGRFSLSNWWSDIRETRATRFHYLGLMIPALMSQPETPADRDHALHSGLGAGSIPPITPPSKTGSACRYTKSGA